MHRYHIPAPNGVPSIDVSRYAKKGFANGQNFVVQSETEIKELAQHEFIVVATPKASRKATAAAKAKTTTPKKRGGSRKGK